MKLSICLGVLVAVLSVFTITNARKIDDHNGKPVQDGPLEGEIYRSNIPVEPQNITKEINDLIPKIQAFIKEINRDPMSLPPLSSRIMYLVKIAISNGWLRGASTTDAVAENVQFYHKRNASYIKGRAHVGLIGGSYDYKMTVFGVGKDGSLSGESGGSTFDFTMRLDHKTLSLTAKKFRIVKYQNVKIKLDNLDLSWLVTNDSLKPLVDLIVRQLEKSIIEIANDLFHKGSTALLNNAEAEPPKITDFNSMSDYVWKVLEQASRQYQ